MAMIELLIRLQRLGIGVELAGDKLRCRIPADAGPEVEDAIRSHKPDLIALLRKSTTKWQVLSASGLQDIQVIPLDHALFLFALRKIQRAPTSDLPGIWKQYARFWRARLDPIAWAFVGEEYQRRKRDIKKA
jgi:hypothetical protein